VKDLSDLTARCIRCGFCLESCPTFILTGEETESPRGRIYLVRSLNEGVLQDPEAIREPIDHCLGCLACETACPSGVEYRSIIEQARAMVSPQEPVRRFLDGLTSPPRLRRQVALAKLWPGKKVPGFAMRGISKEKPEAEKPRAQVPATWPALSEEMLPPVRGEVYLLEGCAMRVMFSRVHEATRRLLRRLGYRVRESEAGCCGSLYGHQGFLDEAQSCLAQTFSAMPDDLPIVVNSAGCGNFLKDHEAAFSDAKRVVDLSEFLAREGLAAALAGSPGFEEVITYHDACHLAHGQRIRSQPRDLLSAIPKVKYVELAEADMCCGSAGIYNLTEPSTARELLERKWQNVERTGARWVVLANPGCHAWIDQVTREQGGHVRVLHLAEALEASFSGLSGLGA